MGKEFIIKDEECEKLFTSAHKIFISYPSTHRDSSNEAQEKRWSISDGWNSMYWSEQYYNCGAVNFYGVPYPMGDVNKAKRLDFLLRNFMKYCGYGVAMMNGYENNIKQFVDLDTGWKVALTTKSARNHSTNRISFAILEQATNMNIKGMKR